MLIHPFLFLSLHHPSYVLRDDLLGGIACGSKHRKYQTIFSELQKKRPSLLLIAATLGSNHLLLSTLYAKWHNIPFLIVTKKHHGEPNLNTRLTKAVAQDQIIYSEAINVELEKLQNKYPDHYLMPLGGFCKLGALGATSLGEQIEAFDQKTPIDYLFLDAGSGLTAASVITYLENTTFKGTIYVITMGPLDFDLVLKQVKEWLEVHSSRLRIEVLRPSIGKSYGSRPSTLQAYAKIFYQKNGILLDPVYNAKLFYTAEQILKTLDPEKNSLVVHSGGDLSALDFFEK